MALRAMLFTCVVAMSACSLHAFAGGTDSPFTLKTQEPRGWLVEYAFREIFSTRIEIGGKPHELFSQGAGGEQGSPILPVEPITLGIPPNSFLFVELVDAEYQSITDQLIAPNPTYISPNVVGVSADSQQIQTAYIKNDASYARNSFAPEEIFSVTPPTYLREQRIATIHLRPYQYNPATKTLKKLIRATLRIHLKGKNGEAMTLPQTGFVPNDPFFEQSYKSIIWNYGQAKQWRGDSELRAPLPPDSTRDWFETGKAYYKIPIADDAWYRVTKQQLVAAGANGNGIDLPTLKVFYRGRQIPIVVTPDTSVEFFARRNYGDSTWTDFYTDTSVYWLTWGGAQGMRFTPMSSLTATHEFDFTSTYETKHFEENRGYYQGALQEEVTEPETIVGEGWEWSRSDDRFYPGVIRSFPIPLELKNSNADKFNLKVRLFGTVPRSSNNAPRLHTASFSLNGGSIGALTFPFRNLGLFSTSINARRLNSGADTLTIESKDWGVSQYYLDWIEVTYSRMLLATNNSLPFTSPTQTFGGVTRLTIRGFTSPQISIYDLTANREVTGGVVSGDSIAGYSIAFKDTFVAPRKFVAAAQGGGRSAAGVIQHFFNDIRANALGADYIIISHRLFLPAAQQLATHRQAVNAVRAKVIDVQDIYDEFNYGIINGPKIKNFLRYTYDQWSLPRPSSLLILGDACWDFHKFLGPASSTNFVPAYGVPAGDNWFVCFNPDTSALAFMNVGRLPVKDSIQAHRIVNKVIGYDSHTLGEWNKRFLFVTGGGSSTEWASFGSLSNSLITSHVLPTPFGANAVRVDKNTVSFVDGGQREVLKGIVNDGCVFLNFIGHSGGRIWSLDIGPPSDLQNTDGKLPFVTSVSCNVGAFADPAQVLSEDFVLADGRAAIASWGAASLGDANTGSLLVGYLLNAARRDSVREFGALTTIARNRLLRGSPSGYRKQAHLNPLLGDPLSRWAIPLKPDLAISVKDIRNSNRTPSPNDSMMTLRVDFYNLGLVPRDSVGLNVTDLFAGQTTQLVADRKFAPTRWRDSLFIPWNATQNIGRHIVSATLDPAGRIPEVNELNNVAAVEQYVYANLISVVKPFYNVVVPPGRQLFVVTSPFGLDSAGFNYEFELDTIDSFDSPARITSGPVTAQAVKGEWLTPTLSTNQVYFWRARTNFGATVGNWTVSSFSVADVLPALPLVRLKESSSRQFRREQLQQTSVTDSGVTLAPNSPINIYCRSVGYRYNQVAEYYSTIRANQTGITGYWWEVGNSFIAMRLNDFTGLAEFRYFPMQSASQFADSMIAFIQNTLPGSYLAFSVIFDGRTNVSEELYALLELQGSTMIRQAQPGMSWSFITRRGTRMPRMTPLESLSNDTAVVQYQVPNYYTVGKGTISFADFSVPTSFDSLRWKWGGIPATSARFAILGVRPNGSVDTLRIVQRDSLNINLAQLNSHISGERYRYVRTAALLSSTDALRTPTLREWSLDLVAPADLAVSARSIAGAAPTDTRTIEVTVHNIGYQQSDSATVTISAFDRNNRARKLTTTAIGRINADQSQTVALTISTSNLPRRATLQIEVTPGKKSKDLVLENNIAYYTIITNGSAVQSDVRVFADGVEIMDGDYVAMTPTLVIRLSRTEGIASAELFVNKMSLGNVSNGFAAKGSSYVSSEIAFKPTLANGNHELKIRLLQSNEFGEIDSLEQTLHVNVLSESRIMQMYNFPNPFRSDTHFTLMLAGAKPPESLIIRIFTIAGRKIRELSVPQSALQIGFNRVYWDGRDNEGDEVANGYYFYQVALDAEGKTTSAIEKLVKVK